MAGALEDRRVTLSGEEAFAFARHGARGKGAIHAGQGIKPSLSKELYGFVMKETSNRFTSCVIFGSLFTHCHDRRSKMKKVSRFVISGSAWKTSILLLPLFLTPIIWISSFSQTDPSACAAEQGSGGDVDFLYGFLQGHYSLVGKFPDSNRTYAGKVILRKSGQGLEVIRKIKGKEVRGTGKIETATADRVKVLRVRFVDAGKNYEATYLIHSDLDNYARLTGYLYLKKGGSRKPGLEALFIDHQF